MADNEHRPGAGRPSTAAGQSNGQQSPPRPRIEIRQAAASPEEAAAIAAAIEQFLRDTAPAPAAAGGSISPWLTAALRENAGLDTGGPWGRGLG